MRLKAIFIIVLNVYVGKIANALDEYKEGSKIKNLGIICKVTINYHHLLMKE